MMNNLPANFISFRQINSVIAGLLLCMGQSFAARPENISESEMSMLPKWCVDTQGFQYGYRASPRTAHWEKVFGNSFWHIHHYCWGLIYLQRAKNSPILSDQRLSLTARALADFEYSTTNAAKDVIILPEIYIRQGETLLMLSDFRGYENRLGNAYESFLRSRQLKPDYWPAYSMWADKLIKSGQTTQAKELVKLGLGHAPTSKVLRDQYKVLGGNPDDISPLAKPAEPTVEAASAAAP